VRHRRPKHGPYRMSSEYSFLVVWAWARVSIAVFVIVDASAVSDKRIKHHESMEHTWGWSGGVSSERKVRSSWRLSGLGMHVVSSRISAAKGGGSGVVVSRVT
jgi:hypothetical protein